MDVHPEDILQRRWMRWGLIFGFWTLLGLIDGSQFYLFLNYYRGKCITWHLALASGLADWYLWALLAPFIFPIGRHFPFEPRRWLRWSIIHLGLCTVFVLLKLAFDLPTAWLLQGQSAIPHSVLESFQVYCTAKFFTYALIYWVIVGVGRAFDYYQKYRERELRASQLEARLAQAQLQLLKMQLHPHFLFNTLHAISALMHQDVDVADRMIARLGELLRATLEMANTQEVTLKEELEFIKPYLEIEQARLGPRLRVRIVVDPETLRARIPNLILQPLVENAIRHGIAPRSEPGRIEIRAKRVRTTLVLQVQDDGPGLVDYPHPPLRQGVGVANTRARLEQLYGAAHRFEMCNHPSRGLVVTVAIPFRQASDHVLPNRTPDENAPAGIPLR
jgi:two-component system LytT family sensor kinase